MRFLAYLFFADSLLESWGPSLSALLALALRDAEVDDVAMLRDHPRTAFKALAETVGRELGQGSPVRSRWFVGGTNGLVLFVGAF